MKRQEIAFFSLGASCVVGAFLIARLEKRVQKLEQIVSLMHECLDLDLQKEIDEQFDGIVERLGDE